MRTSVPLAAVLIVLCLTIAAVLCAAGTLTDRDGGTHSWVIDDGHVLMWDGTPYLPFGIVFEPRYLTAGQTDANLTADQEDIEAFKLSGIVDIIIRPSRGLTLIPAAAVQKIIDLLETNGMHYGLELYDPDYVPLTGYVVQPMANRADNITVSGEIARDTPNADSAIYALCDARTGEVRDYGRQLIAGGKLTVPVVNNAGSAEVLLFYPHQPASDEGLFDVWKGFDAHRDHLIVYMKQIKFGKGLRFFSDPFGETFGIGGDAESTIPTSTAFRFEYAAWLSKRYSSPGDLNIAWGILKHDLNSFDEASRLIPLWSEGRGAALVYDEAMSKAYSSDASKSAIWDDLRRFRWESVRNYMDAMADVAKRISADVPVVFTATGLQPIFRTSGPIGYDGLVTPGADTNDALIMNAARTLSLADTSSRKMWLLCHLRPAGGVYKQKQDLFGAMNSAHDLGAKGFFVDDAHGSGVDGATLVSWLAEYAALSGNDKRFATYKPNVITYPENISHTGVRRLANGAWWLPTLGKGADLQLGTNLAGYAATDPTTFDITICVWSLKGTQTIHIAAETGLTVAKANGAPVDVKPRKGRVELVVGEEPMFIHGMSPEQFLPVEMVQEAVVEFEKAIARGDQKHMDTSDYKDKLKSAQAMLTANQLGLCMDLVRSATDELNQRLRGLQVIPQLGS